MCGPLREFCGLCCSACFRTDKKPHVCCFCIPLRIGAIFFASLCIVIDIVLVLLFTIRYYEDPFENMGKVARSPWGEHSLLWREVRTSLQPVVSYAQPLVVVLALFFAVWGCIDVGLLVATVLHLRMALQIWVLLSLVRVLHVFVDTFLIVITYLYVHNCIRYLYPNFVSLASLLILMYARGIIVSYAREIKSQQQIRGDEERRMSTSGAKSSGSVSPALPTKLLGDPKYEGPSAPPPDTPPSGNRASLLVDSQPETPSVPVEPKRSRPPSQDLQSQISSVLFENRSRSRSNVRLPHPLLVQSVSLLEERLFKPSSPRALEEAGSSRKRSRSQRSDGSRGARRRDSPALASDRQETPPRGIGAKAAPRVKKNPPPQRRAMPVRKSRAPAKRRSMP